VFETCPTHVVSGNGESVCKVAKGLKMPVQHTPFERPQFTYKYFPQSQGSQFITLLVLLQSSSLTIIIIISRTIIVNGCQKLKSNSEHLLTGYTATSPTEGHSNDQ
jgi:hypothetical protein